MHSGIQFYMHRIPLYSILFQMAVKEVQSLYCRNGRFQIVICHLLEIVHSGSKNNDRGLYNSALAHCNTLYGVGNCKIVHAQLLHLFCNANGTVSVCISLHKDKKFCLRLKLGSEIV